MKLTLISAIATALVAATTSTAKLVTPFDDSFYYPPNNTDWESLKLGEIIKIRPIPNKPAKLENVDKAFQILYRSSNTFDEPVAAVTTVFVPKDAKSDKIVTYGYPEDSSWPLGECSFSYEIQSSGSDATVQSLLDKGIIVNAPDYEGPNDAFCAVTLAGKLTLDSIRATLNSADKTGVDKDANIGLWGYSGGSVAGGWATQLQEQYAPDLNIVGTAVGGFVANLTAVSLYNNKQLTAGFLPAGIMGMASEFPKVQELVDKQLKPARAAYFKKVLKQCMGADMITYLFNDIFDYFKDGEKVLQEPALAEVLGNSTLAQTNKPPKAPLFVYQGMKDTIVPYESVDAVIADYCANGAKISYNKFPEGDHGTTATDGAQDALQFLLDALEGKKDISNCATTTASGKFTHTATWPGAASGSSSSASSVPSASASASVTSSSSNNGTASASATATATATGGNGGSGGSSDNSTLSGGQQGTTVYERSTVVNAETSLVTLTHCTGSDVVSCHKVTTQAPVTTETRTVVTHTVCSGVTKETTVTLTTTYCPLTATGTSVGPEVSAPPAPPAPTSGAIGTAANTTAPSPVAPAATSSSGVAQANSAAKGFTVGAAGIAAVAGAVLLM